MSAQIIAFKNNLPNLTVLQIHIQNLTVLKNKIQQKIKQAPMMFIGMQVVVDISVFDREKSLALDVAALLAFLQGEGLNPVAVMTDRASFREMLLKAGIGVIPVLKNTNERPKVKTVAKPVAEKKSEKRTTDSQAQDEPKKTFADGEKLAKQSPNNATIQHPVRSGQRVYAKGDLTVIGSVSPGAEVIAGGNIHIYGRLSGRAIAGASGDVKARIFCQKLDAELVSIAGNYKQLEEIDEAHLNQAVQILLENEKIRFSSL